VGALASSGSYSTELPPDPPGARLRVVVGGASPRARYETRFDPQQPSMRWTLWISGAESPGELQLHVEARGLAAGAQLHLTDVESGGSWELEPGATITLAATTAPRRLTLEVTTSAAGHVPGTTRAIVYPNPSAARTGLWLTLSDPRDVRVEIFDLAGRRVWTREEQGVAAGEHVWTWEGRNQRGETLGAGVYLARCTIGSQVRTLRVIRL
jgi:hypothetical protein